MCFFQFSSHCVMKTGEQFNLLYIQRGIQLRQLLLLILLPGSVVKPNWSTISSKGTFFGTAKLLAHYNPGIYRPGSYLAENYTTLPLLVQSTFPLTLVPGISSPNLSTHQQNPVEGQHCSELKLPSVLHLGTKEPNKPPFCEAWELSCSHFVAA